MNDDIVALVEYGLSKLAFIALRYRNNIRTVTALQEYIGDDTSRVFQLRNIGKIKGESIIKALNHYNEAVD